MMENHLADQLVVYANILMGYSPPDHFTEWLDEVCKTTGAWTKEDEVVLKNKKLQ